MTGITQPVWCVLLNRFSARLSRVSAALASAAQDASGTWKGSRSPAGPTSKSRTFASTRPTVGCDNVVRNGSGVMT